MNIDMTKTEKIPLIKRNLSLKDMIGRYKSIEPINCVELKHKMK